MKLYHKLEILHRNIFLDDFRVEGVLSYQLEKVDSTGLANLELTLSVPDYPLKLNNKRVPEKKRFSTIRHQFEKDNEKLFLDSFELSGVNSYKVTSSAVDKSAELVINLTVLDTKIIFCNGRNSNRN